MWNLFGAKPVFKHIFRIDDNDINKAKCIFCSKEVSLYDTNITFMQKEHAICDQSKVEAEKGEVKRGRYTCKDRRHRNR